MLLLYDILGKPANNVHLQGLLSMSKGSWCLCQLTYIWCLSTVSSVTSFTIGMTLLCFEPPCTMPLTIAYMDSHALHCRQFKHTKR